VEVTVVVEAWVGLNEINVALGDETEERNVRPDDDENALATVEDDPTPAAFLVTVVVTVTVTIDATHKREPVDGDMVFIVGDGAGFDVVSVMMVVIDTTDGLEVVLTEMGRTVLLGEGKLL
jgi:hypothetical protein